MAPLSSADRPAERLPAALWRLAFAAGLAFYLDAATLITVAVALPVWRDHYQLGTWQVGVLSSGLAFAVAVGALSGGWLGDAVGRARVFTVDLMIFVLGTVLILFATGPTTLVAGVIVVGLAAGADVPTALAVISDAAPARVRGRLVALTQVFWIGAILATFALGFAVSGLGFRGTQLLSAHLVVVAVVTVGLRLVIGRAPGPDSSRPRTRPAAGPRRLRRSGAVPPLLATGGFYLCWNIASTTLGSYGIYLLVTVTGLSQSEATGLVLVTFPAALIMSVIFIRLADSAWRDRLFVVAMAMQIAAFASGAASGGTAVGGMIALIALYSLSNVFAGEAIYKVWSQLLLPAAVRSTALGATYAIARAVAAAFLLTVPAIIETHSAALLWILTGCVTASGTVGLVITRRRAWHATLRPTPEAVVRSAPDAISRDAPTGETLA